MWLAHRLRCIPKVRRLTWYRYAASRFGCQFVGRAMKRVYNQIEIGSVVPSKTLGRAFRIIGAFLTPLYLLRATLAGAPGTLLHLKCMALALRLLVTGRASLSESFAFAVCPFDSVRYFEFEVLLGWLRSVDLGHRYLDVSSPRLFFLFLLKANPNLHAWLINPDKNDLTITQDWICKFALQDRSLVLNCLLADARLPSEGFETISSISVIEHIPEPEDVSVLRELWQALRPGGRLLLSVPCAAEAFEEYLNFNEYGVLKTGEDGYVFGQRFYDEALLESHILQIVGPPVRARVFGEKESGAFVANRAQKVRGGFYPFWRESLMMGREYGSFERIRDLPGLGVITMEFIKPPES